MKSIFLKTDSRNRIVLTKLIKEEAAAFYKAYIDKSGKIILEPIRELSDEDAWLFAPENKTALNHLKESLQQKAHVNLGSFKKHLK